MNQLVPSTGIYSLKTLKEDLVIHQEYNEYPDIIQYDKVNPMLSSPNAEYDLPFYQTKETLVDPEIYKSFLNNAISRFRRSRDYKNYKSYLFGLGLDHSAELGNISSEMIDDALEMHHNFITIFDIAMMICEHILNTIGAICTFDLISLLKLEHEQNNIPIVMLDITSHEIYHDDPNYRVPINRVWGSWWILFDKYRYGVTLDIAYKVIRYVNYNANILQQNYNDPYIQSIFKLRDNLKDWSAYNEYGTQYNNAGYLTYTYDNTSSGMVPFNGNNLQYNNTLFSQQNKAIPFYH